ncbi:MAG: galactokinase [Bacteroidota bacterium]
MFKLHSPGRINIIGEHLDYNGGLVLPAAVDRGITFEVKPKEGKLLKLHALDLGKTEEVDPNKDRPTGIQWVDYLLGICYEFRQLGHEIPALEIAFGGDLPSGAGMSSSAALEGGMAFLLNEITGAELTRSELAQLSRRSSNNFIGVPVGIMDQFASLNGQEERALMLNCDTLEYEAIPANLPGYTWLLVNSCVSHDLAESAYGDRVNECKAGLYALQKVYPEIKQLAQASITQLERVADDISDVVYKRCCYVIKEQSRILAAVEALKDQSAKKLGQLLNATHAGLRDDYEVSCPEVDFLQAFAEQHDAVLGSRIMGGGFGGCTLNLVLEQQVESFTESVQEAYLRKYKLKAPVYSVKLSDGTKLL